MARLLYTTQNLVDEIRAQLDEQNADSVDTALDILPTLNRAQDFAWDILANKYKEPILAKLFMPLISNQAEYPIHDNVFEDRILKVEVEVPATGPGIPSDPESTGNIGSTFREIQRIDYRDISNYESASRTNVPYYYVIYGRTIRMVPTPTGAFGVRIWYLRNPEKLVLPQGRITAPATPGAGNYLIVDQAGASLTTEADQLESYVNVVSGNSGEIRGTLQIQSISGNRIQFRSTPVRTSVLGRTVTGDLSTVSPQLDDYLCPVDGTCVPYFGRPVSNFVIQFSVSEITRKLGGDAATEESILDKFEKQVSRVWSGREQQLRIKKRSQNWGVPTRRWYFQ